MICYRDMAFCSDANECANRVGCSRWFSQEQSEGARRWWGGEGAPIALSSFKASCKQWKESEK